jgi:hypothetical protein
MQELERATHRARPAAMGGMGGMGGGMGGMGGGMGGGVGPPSPLEQLAVSMRERKRRGPRAPMSDEDRKAFKGGGFLGAASITGSVGSSLGFGGGRNPASVSKPPPADAVMLQPRRMIELDDGPAEPRIDRTLARDRPIRVRSGLLFRNAQDERDEVDMEEGPEGDEEAAAEAGGSDAFVPPSEDDGQAQLAEDRVLIAEERARLAEERSRLAEERIQVVEQRARTVEDRANQAAARAHAAEQAVAKALEGADELRRRIADAEERIKVAKEDAARQEEARKASPPRPARPARPTRPARKAASPDRPKATAPRKSTAKATAATTAKAAPPRARGPRAANPPEPPASEAPPTTGNGEAPAPRLGGVLGRRLTGSTASH